jgi:hypothetical protein
LKKSGKHYGFHLAPPLGEFNQFLSQHANLASIIMLDRTSHQNRIISRYRRLRHQRKVAEELGITQQAVSESLKIASWKELKRTEDLITSQLARA